MQVVLIQDLDNLGGKNELVTVKDGYARNFLIPKKLAIEATPSNIKQLEEKIKVRIRKEKLMISEINIVINALNASPIRIGAKTGATGKIFGSVTPLQIARAIKEQRGYEIDRKKISIPDEVKELGEYKATIEFTNEIKTDIVIEVFSE